MKKYTTYLELQAQVEKLTQQLQKLEVDEKLEKTLAFKAALENLMEEYEATQSDVLSLLGLDDVSKSADKRRGQRPMKVFKNPNTGEVVETRGGNHKTLNAWREEYGKDEVDTWLES